MNLPLEDLSTGVNIFKDEILYQFVKEFINQIEKIIAIDPSLTEKEILQIVAKTIVDYLGAQVASMRIYNPEREEMVSLGSYPHEVEVYEETIPLENTIAGEVAKTGQTFLVSNIFKEEKYKNKEKAKTFFLLRVISDFAFLAYLILVVVSEYTAKTIGESIFNFSKTSWLEFSPQMEFISCVVLIHMPGGIKRINSILFQEMIFVG